MSCMCTSIPGSSSSWCPAGAGCPGCLSCSLLICRRASSLIKTCHTSDVVPLQVFRDSRTYSLHCCSILFSGFHAHRCIDEFVVLSVSRCTLLTVSITEGCSLVPYLCQSWLTVPQEASGRSGLCLVVLVTASRTPSLVMLRSWVCELMDMHTPQAPYV